MNDGTGYVDWCSFQNVYHDEKKTELYFENKEEKGLASA